MSQHNDEGALGTAYFAVLIVVTVVSLLISQLPDRYLRFSPSPRLRNVLAILMLLVGALAVAYFAWRYLPYSPTPG